MGTRPDHAWSGGFTAGEPSGRDNALAARADVAERFPAWAPRPAAIHQDDVATGGLGGGPAPAEHAADVDLADRALLLGARRHTPVTLLPDLHVVHGTRVRHSTPHGELESVAVLYPEEEDGDPTAGLWWVLVSDVDGCS